MTRLVVDASVAVKWVVAEKESTAAVALRPHELLAPDLIFVECANVLWAKSRRSFLTRDEAVERLALLLHSPIRVTPTRELTARALELALELDHPVYDCVYLALALERDARLVTADRRFVRSLAAHARYREAASSLGDA